METNRIVLCSIIIFVISGIIFGIAISSPKTIQEVGESGEIKKGDIVMSNKVSRPGCEKTDSCYKPSKFIIKQGYSITWINEDAAFHSVTSGFYGEPNVLFDSGYLDPEESFTFTFENVGTYDYFCTLHPWMKGQIIVN